MKVVAIVQARMTSTRLPGKVLEELAGASMLARVIERVRRASSIGEIVIATTTNATDDSLASAAMALGVHVTRGDEHDVLSRYQLAALEAAAAVVVRITSDCPLVDPVVIDRCVARVLDTADPVDYASNTIERTYPRGLDVEAFHRDTLERMVRLATSRSAREHVTYFLHRERPDLFVVAHVRDTADNSDLRWTVDTPEDLAMVREIYGRAQLAKVWVPYEGVVALVRNDPTLQAINAGIEQKSH